MENSHGPSNTGKYLPKNLGLKHSFKISRGCTTPQQIQNLKNSIEDNIDYLDGFDELPSDLQAKVLKTLEEGHVDDAEWKGVRGLPPLPLFST
jgi:hypothetical protein